LDFVRPNPLLRSLPRKREPSLERWKRLALGPRLRGGHSHIVDPNTRVAGLRLGRAVPQRSLPPCGGGTGRGVQQARRLFPMRREQKHSSLLFVSWSARRISFALGVLSPPLSLSLTHKGGGNRGVRTFATHAMCARMDFQKVLSVKALRYMPAVIRARNASQCRQKRFAAHVFIERLPLGTFAVACPRQQHGQGLMVEQRQACPEAAGELLCQCEVRVARILRRASDLI